MPALDTIFIDLDGVIRHWDGRDILAAERAIEVTPGTLFRAAFSPELLGKAITGVITHEEWVDEVGAQLTAEIGSFGARSLVDAWGVAAWSIDHELLGCIRVLVGSATLVLVTNATDRLGADLSRAKLSTAFDVIVNSSEEGVAKPAASFYVRALERSGATIESSVFIDDTREHVDAARAFGFEPHHHTSRTTTLAFLARMLQT